MTAEVAILNKSAVALAADSAVTIPMSDGGAKIYNTVNKLFGLYPNHLVGVMIFGSAQIMQTPWETIIKLYRSQLKPQQFKNLEDYGDDFIRFLKKGNGNLINVEKQRIYFEQRSLEIYELLKSYFLRAVKDHIKQNKKISEAELNRMMVGLFKKIKESVSDCDRIESLKGISLRNMVARIRKATESQLKNVFQEFNISGTMRRTLAEIVADSFKRDLGTFESFSGFIVAGFGSSEEFPAVVGYDIDGMIGRSLRYVPRLSKQITVSDPAFVLPVAQREEVDAFLSGIHIDYRSEIRSYVRNILTGLPREILAEAGIKNRRMDRALTKMGRDEWTNFKGCLSSMNIITIGSQSGKRFPYCPKTNLRRWRKHL